jgi:hypothetical protein
VTLLRAVFAVTPFFLGLALAGSPATADPRPTVVELFTSQGCSSCPPADALLGELATRGDVIALGFHINYWDSLGWKDPFSSPESTERQRTYGRLFETQVYTPQLVVDGIREMVGSRREEVIAALREASHEAIAPVAFAADRHSVTIGPATTASGSGQVWLIRFVQKRTTRVGAGENARRTAEDANGVEALATLGAWQGAGVEFAVEPAPRSCWDPRLDPRSSNQPPAAVRAAVEQGAAAAPWPDGDAAHMQFQMVSGHLDRDQAGGDHSFRVVIGRTAKPALDRLPVVDQLGMTGQSDIGSPGIVLIGQRHPTGSANFRGFSADARGQEPARPEILARGARLRLDDARIGAAVARLGHDPAKRHFADCVAGGGEQPLDLPLIFCVVRGWAWHPSLPCSQAEA